MLNDLKYIDSIYNLSTYVWTRIVTLILGIVVFVVYENIFPLWIYLTILAAYIYCILKFKDGIRVHFLANISLDYLLIFFIVLGKPIHEYDILLLIATPIINLISCKENLSNCLIVISLPFLCILSNDFLCNLDDISWGLFRAYIVSILLVLALYYLVGYKKFKKAILNAIDQYYLSKEEFYKPHKIYGEILRIIRRSMPNIDIDIIASFIVNTEPHMLVNSSKLIWRCHININPNFARPLRQHKLYPVSFAYDNRNRPYSLLYIDNVKDINYGYVIAFNKKPSPFNIIVLFSFVRLFCHKYSRILYSQHIVRQIETEKREKTNENLKYINHAVNTMHFIRNRLSPFNNLIEILQSSTFDNLRKLPNEKLRPIILKEIKRCGVELNDLQKRADYLLNNDNNPADYQNIKKFSVVDIYKMVSNLWYGIFSENIDINGDPEILSHMRVNVNEDGIYIVFADWIANMDKHGDGEVSLVVDVVNNDELAFIFRNNHKLSESDTKKLLSDINNDTRNEIVRRKTHGLYSIKTISEAMGMKIHAEQENAKIKFTIYLKMYKYESVSY